MDTVRLYQVFLHIARTGAVSRAAVQLGCSTAAASRQLEALESELGVRLFDRTTRSVRLTAAGQRLLPQAEAVLQALEDARASVDVQQVQATVRVCAPIAIGVEWVAPALARLHQQRAALRVELLLDNGSTNAFGEGVDILVRSGLAGRDEPADLVVRSVGRFALGVYAAPGWVQSLGPQVSEHAWAEQPWLGHLAFPTGAGLTLQRGQQVCTLPIQPRFWSNDTLALVHAAAQGGACVVLPQWLAAPWVAQGRLQPVLGDWTLAQAELVLAWRNRGSNRAAIAQVATHLRGSLQACCAADHRPAWK
jgi:DNA-binding transcriptional LysR family regulator